MDLQAVGLTPLTDVRCRPRLEPRPECREVGDFPKWSQEVAGLLAFGGRCSVEVVPSAVPCPCWPWPSRPSLTLFRFVPERG